MRPKWEKVAAKDNLLFALAGLTGVVIYQFSENIAINYTTASNVSVIVSQRWNQALSRQWSWLYELL